MQLDFSNPVDAPALLEHHAGVKYFCNMLCIYNCCVAVSLRQRSVSTVGCRSTRHSTQHARIPAIDRPVCPQTLVGSRTFVQRRGLLHLQTHTRYQQSQCRIKASTYAPAVHLHSRSTARFQQSQCRINASTYAPTAHLAVQEPNADYVQPASPLPSREPSPPRALPTLEP